MISPFLMPNDVDDILIFLYAICLSSAKLAHVFRPFSTCFLSLKIVDVRVDFIF